MTVPSKGAFSVIMMHLVNNNIEMIVFTVLLVFLPTGQSTASPQELEIAIGGYETAAWSTTESI